MTKVIIPKGNLSTEDIAALKSLISDAGIPNADVGIEAAVLEPESSGADEAVIVLLSAATCGSPSFADDLAAIPGGGRRAICVWPADADGAAMPDASVKFAYSIISWNPERLRVALAADDTVCMEDPNGDPLPDPEPDHLECE